MKNDQEKEKNVSEFLKNLHEPETIPALKEDEVLVIEETVPSLGNTIEITEENKKELFPELEDKSLEKEKEPVNAVMEEKKNESPNSDEDSTITESKEQKNKNRKFIIIIIILVLLIAGLLGYIVVTGDLLGNSNEDTEVVDKDAETSIDKESDVTPEVIPTPESTPESTPEVLVGKKLNVYVSDSGNGYISIWSSAPTYNSSDIQTYTITCKTTNCTFTNNGEFYDVGVGDYVFVQDDGKTSVYDYKNDKVVNTLENIKNVYVNSRDDVSVAVLEGTNGKWGAYSPLKNKVTIPVEYSNIEEIVYYFANDTRGPGYDIVFKNNLVIEKNGKYGLVNFETGKTTLQFSYDEISCYYYQNYDGVTGNLTTSDTRYCKVKMNNEYEILIYDAVNGRVTKNANKYTEWYEILDSKYAYANQDGKLLLVDLNDFHTVTTFDDFDSSDIFYFMTNYTDDNGNNNILVQFKEPGDEYVCVEYYYNEVTKKSTKKDNVECGAIAKPVLYLYPEEITEVTVNFSKENLLTTTYPKFVNEWKVTASPNGDLYDSDGKYYYGLYWEEKPTNFVDFSEGFYVDKNDAIAFLEEKLTYIGLNNKERNEFIMYWLPILESNGKSLVYFELTEEREDNNKILITPQPDSLLRMVMHVKKVDKKINIKPQQLVSFERKGFTAVEWGGYNYSK